MFALAERFSEWLARKMAGAGIDQTTLGVDLDINPSVVSRWLRGASRPRASNIVKLADYFNIPAQEVFRMMQPDGEADGKPTSFDQRLRESFAELMAERPIAIPIHDQAASAGFGQTVLEYSYWEPPRVAGRNIVGVRVHGNSMEPEIMDGDTVYIDKDMAAEAGNIVVATLGDEVLVKKLRKRGGKLVLAGANGEWDAAEAKIEGVVIQLSRDLGGRHGR